jgi:hypothetical protein
VLRRAFAQARQELFMAEWEVHTCSNFLLDCLHVFRNLDQNSFHLSFGSAKGGQVGGDKYVFLIKTQLGYSGFPVHRFDVIALKKFRRAQPKFADHYLLQQRSYKFMASFYVMEVLEGPDWV